jgi:hypothetical protein
MQPVELTYMRALKVWWSFLWRTWLMMIPITFGVVVLMLVVLWLTGGFEAFRHPEAGKAPFGLGVMALMYLVIFPTMLLLQAFTMKLALKVKWSDFQLVAVGQAPAPTAHSSQPPLA